MPFSALKSPTRSAPPEGFAAISSCVLAYTPRLCTKVYAMSGARHPSLLSEAGADPDQIKSKLQQFGADHLLLKHTDLIALGTQVLRDSPELLTDARLPQGDRLSILLASLGSESEQAGSLIKPGKLIDLCRWTADKVFELMHAGRVDPLQLHYAPRLANSWMNHAAATSCYSVLLAISTGTGDEEECRKIALGAMLHDLGLRRPPEESSSSDAKREWYAGHPQRAYEELSEELDICRDQLLMIYQHHEALDGGGFPVGILQAEIHPWAQMLRVVDEFDELTNCGPERQRLSIEEALAQLNRNAGEKLNGEMVQCWTRIMTRT